jgi:hypothetical protein
MSGKSVLRGLHFQRAPYEQGKLVRIIQGAVLDVVVDIRKDSPTFGKNYSTLLDAKSKKMLLTLVNLHATEMVHSGIVVMMLFLHLKHQGEPEVLHCPTCQKKHKASSSDQKRLILIHLEILLLLIIF